MRSKRRKEPALREVLTSFMSTIFSISFSLQMKMRKVKFQKTILFLRFHLRLDFLCLISLVSSFAKEETRETRRKEKKEERLSQSRWAFWRNGSFASSAQTVSRLLGVTAGVNPVRKSDSTGFACLFRWWRWSFAHHLPGGQRDLLV